MAYERQHRGSEQAYDEYLRGMDASMRQKVALTAAHLLCEGRVADMGMGSGSGSFALASLYPELEVVGVDVSPEMVERATEKYRLPNLSFVLGDVAAPCFPPGSLEAIVDSSVLHHVTSFGGYDHGAAARCLAVQAEELCDGGVLVLRDFVDPGPETVWLDVRTDDGDESDDPRRCSTARLLERFAREFRALRAPSERGFPSKRVEGAPAGFQRYELSLTHAAELVLRKDYRESWESEVLEEYTYGTQADLEAVMAGLGMRVLASTPIRNPWIVRHRFEGKIALYDLRGAALDPPPTNYVLVGQKVAAGQGVRIVEARECAPGGYLELTAWEHAASGKRRDLARRPGVTLDAVPWFRSGGSAHVLARRSYPRPILCCGGRPIDGAGTVTYVTEPLTVVQGDKPAAQTAEELVTGLGLSVRAIAAGPTHYPSAGGIQEEVRTVFVEVEPRNVAEPLADVSGFSSSGVVRAIEARQLLRAAQVGGLPDARLELATYDLLGRLGIDPGEWIGEAIAIAEGGGVARGTLAREPRRAWRRGSGAAGFLSVRCAEFHELDASGRCVASQTRERVEPCDHRLESVAVAVLRCARGEVFLGLDDDDLPAAQCFEGRSDIWVTPAWRLPRSVHWLGAMRDFVRERLRVEHGVAIGGVFELGGRYHPSAGLTAEVVYPLAVEVIDEVAPPAPLVWVPLAEVVEERASLRDGHLRIVSLRAAHALRLLGRSLT
jgi:hypothetical protein